MSRGFWVVVGAAGGIYAYRRGTRAVDTARERGLVGNVQAAAGTASALAGGASRLLALASPDNELPVLNPAPSPEPGRVRVSSARRTASRRQELTITSSAQHFPAIDSDIVVDVRDQAKTSAR